MSQAGEVSKTGSPLQSNSPRTVIPKTAAGWWALGLALVGVLAWVVLPLITMTFRDMLPITDTWVMPAIGILLIDLAAIYNIVSLWHWRERSVLNIAAVVLVVPLALILTVIVVGEGIAGV